MSQIKYISSTLQEMFDNVPGSSFQDKLNHLANCHCCERHQVNKPTIFAPLNETHPYTYNLATYPCMCQCRQLSRFICRQAPGYHWPPITRNNTPTSVIDARDI